MRAQMKKTGEQQAKNRRKTGEIKEGWTADKIRLSRVTGPYRLVHGLLELSNASLLSYRE